MSDKPCERRVVMAKILARRWVREASHAEYRFEVLYGSREIRNLPGLLRSFRDGKIAMSGVPVIRDLGMRETFDALALWSSDRIALGKLASWFEERGFETTGVW